MSKVTTIVTIDKVSFGAEVLNEKTGIKTRIVNLVFDTKISKGRKLNGTKEIVQQRGYGISKGELDSLMNKDELLRHLPFSFTINKNHKVVKNIGSDISIDDINYLNELIQTSEGETDVLNQQYKDHFDKLHGAVLTIVREEITKEEVDEDGQVIVDEAGNPKVIVIGYGESEITDLKIDDVARGLINQKLFGKN